MFKGIRKNLRKNTPYLVILVLVSALVVVFFFDRIVITIRSGEAGVHYRRFLGGTVTDRPYPEGINLIYPWDKMYVYNVRHQVLHHEFEVLTKRGLPVIVTLSIRYQPDYELVGLLHQRVGPGYVDVIVKPEVEATIRTVFGQYDVDEVYTTKRAVAQRVINRSLEQAAQNYVTIDDVLITRITLPKVIKSAIESKLVEEQRLKAYEFILAAAKKEAERKEIEAWGIDAYQRVVSSSLTQKLLTEKGIRATRELAESDNSKVVVIGGGKLGLPIILGGETARQALTGETPSVTMPDKEVPTTSRLQKEIASSESGEKRSRASRQTSALQPEVSKRVQGGTIVRSER